MSNNIKQICCNCIENDFLKKYLGTHGRVIRCSYCKGKDRGISIDKMADMIETAFEQFYTRSADEPSSWEYRLMSDKESTFSWERHGVHVIEAITNTAEIEERAAYDIQEILEERFSDFDSAASGLETEFASDSYYEPKIIDDEYWQREWEEFERRLKNEARHFNQFGIKLLDIIFEGIDKLNTDNGNSLVTLIGPEAKISMLYRARVFHTNEKLREALMYPDQQLGPPPNSHTLPGRMNARGISMFYGAIEEETAIGEVRPPVGSKVVVSKFDILKELKLLNLNALQNLSSRGSIFDPEYINQVQKDIFLRRLSLRMSTPVMPNDEPIDYLITQAIADYLAIESKFQFDGIMYPSVQSDKKGINVVLFQKSSRVKPYIWNLEADIASYTDEGWVNDYYVRKKSRKKKIIVRKYHNDILDKDIAIASNDDTRPFSLSVDISAIRIHHIAAVKFSADPHDLYVYK